MKDQGWHIELLKVLGKVRLRESLDAIVARLHSPQHPLEPPLLTNTFRNLGARPVVTVERKGNVPVKLRPILRILGSQVIENLDRCASRIFVCLQHQRWNGADEHSPADTFCAVATDVTGNFSTAGGMSNVDCIFQVE